MKTLKTLASFMIIALPIASNAGHAIYKSIGHQTLVGNDQTRSVTAKGFWVFDPDTERGTAIVSFVLDGRKLFTIVPLQNYRIEHVTGQNGAAYTVIAKAESPGTQYAGVLLESVYLRGRDSAVTVDSQGIRFLPRTFSASARSIAKNTQTGVTVAGEVTGSYTLDIKGSQASNLSETFDVAVIRFGQFFISQGYAQVTLPPAQ